MTREAPDVEHMDLPDSDWSENAPGETIKGGETHPPDETVRLNGPPGTGKTTEISKRIAYLIEEEDVNPNNIILVTYRRELADAVESRLGEWGVLSGEEELEYWTTVHAAANRATGVLSAAAQQQHDDQWLGPAVEEAEKIAFCNGVLGIDYYNEEQYEATRGKLAIDVIEYCRANKLDPTDDDEVNRAPMYDELMSKWPGVDVEELYRTFEDWKSQRYLYEFNELLEAALDGELPSTEVVVIDEYHDATPLMAELCERWIDAAETAIIAGDPLQVVSAFRGADPRFFEDELDHIPEILLDETYRVPEEHWQAATRMLEQELDAPPVTRSTRGKIYEFSSPEFSYSQDAGWTVPAPSRPGSPGDIHDRFDIHDDSDRSIMYLTRTRKQSSGVSKALDKAGIVHDAQDDDDGWSDRRRVLFNAIRKLRDVSPSFGQDRNTYGLSKYQNGDDGEAGVTMYFSTDEAAAIIEHSKARLMDVSRSEAEDWVEDIEDEEAAVPVEDIDDIVTPEWWRTYCRGIDSVSDILKAGELDDWDFEALRTTLQRRDEHIDDDELRETRVMTCNASKGSEASDVVVYDGITQRTASDIEYVESARENEARTWYVSLTRASERLHLVRGGFDWMIPHLPDNLRTVAANDAAAAVNGGEASGD